MNIQNQFSDNLSAFITGTGVRTDPDRNNATAANRGLTLAAGTYFVPLNVTDEDLMHVQLRWNAAFAGTITLETSDFPVSGPDGVADVSDWSTGTGDWLQENPTTAYVTVTGTGNSATYLTITAGGTNAGGAGVHLEIWRPAGRGSVSSSARRAWCGLPATGSESAT